MEKKFVLGLFEKRVHGLRAGGRTKTFQQAGSVREQTETGQNVQMQRMVRAADQKEKIGPLAVLRAEEDRTDRPAEREKRFLEKIRIVIARMEKRHAAAGGGGGDFFAGTEFGEERFGVVEQSGGVRLIRHVAQDAGLGFRREIGPDGFRPENVGDVEIVAGGLAPLVAGQLMFAGQLFVGQGDEAALRPFVQGPVLKEIVVSAFNGRHFLALREMTQFVGRHVQMRGGAFQIHQMVVHGRKCIMSAVEEKGGRKRV